MSAAATPSSTKYSVALLQLQIPAEGAGAGETTAWGAAAVLLGVDVVLAAGADVTAVDVGALQSVDVVLAGSQPMVKAVRLVAAK